MTKPTGVVPSSRRWAVLAVCSVAVFMTFLDVTIVNIAFPSLREDFSSAGLGELSWVINGYSIVFAASLIPIGRLADRWGRRRVFLTGVTVFVVASAACGLAPTVWLLIAARVVQAVGAAAVVPTSMALLLPEFPLSQRATAAAIWGSSGGIAAAAGPSLGGALIDWADWRLVFFVNVPVGLVALVPAVRLVRESRETDSVRGFDLIGAGLLAVGIAAVALGVVEGPDWGWTSPGVVAAFAVGAVLLGALALRCARHPAPIVEPALFRVRSFTAANAGTIVFAVGFYALLLCNVLFLTGVGGYSVVEAGLALTPGPLVAAAVSPVAGRLADRFGQRAVALPGGLTFAAGAAYLAVAATAEIDYVGAFLPGVLLTGAGAGLSISSFGSAAVAELPRNRFATGSAVTSCFRQIGAVLGVAILLAIIGDAAPESRLGAVRAAWWVMSVAGLASACCAAALGRVRARDTTAAPRPAVPTTEGAHP